MKGVKVAVKRRRLQDLYVIGQEVVIRGKLGEEIVWLQKLNTPDQEDVHRSANAVRARLLQLRNDPESEEFLAAYAEAMDYGAGKADELIDYLIRDDLNEIRLSRDAEMASEDEWSKDDYLQGLRDAWEGTHDDPGLKEAWIRDPEDEEANRVMSEIKRFTESVDKQLESEKENLRRNYENLPLDELAKRVAKLFLESKANGAWLREVTIRELFHAVRESDDHSKKYFAKRSELDQLPDVVLTQLAAAYARIKVDPLEGKDSAATGISSHSSDPHEQEETESSSGPVAVTL